MSGLQTNQAAHRMESVAEILIQLASYDLSVQVELVHTYLVTVTFSKLLTEWRGWQRF